MRPPRAPRFRVGAFFSFLVAGLLIAFPPPAEAVRFDDITLPEADASPQVFEIRFEEAVQFRKFDRLISNGYYYLDFYGITGTYPQREWRLGREGISVVRQIQYPEHDVLRFVFYTFQNLETTLELGSTAPGTFRLTARSVATSNLGQPPGAGGTGSRKVVFIDPGHGGHNAGAQTSRPVDGRHYEEKDVALAITRRLIPLLQRAPNLDVKVSRINDTFVSLEDRIRMSDAAKADLFLSIHLNATDQRRKTARGFEVFYLSDERRATNRWLEVMENTQGISAGEGSDGQHLRQLLTEISDEDFARRRGESRLLSNIIERTFAREGPFRGHIRGSKPAAFRVLMNYNAPAVLVECGFLDNPQDAFLVTQPRVQNDIAALLFNAINLYFARTDPTFQPYVAPLGS